MQQNQPQIQNWQSPLSKQFHAEQGPESIIPPLFLPTLYIFVPSFLLDRNKLSLWKIGSGLHKVFMPLDATVFNILLFVASHHSQSLRFQRNVCPVTVLSQIFKKNIIILLIP